MFDIFFGWRKASKCKKLIRRVQSRLKLLKNKRSSIARQLREDVSQLIRTGHQETAFNRAEQLFNDLSLVSVYELLDQFCEFILVHLSYIRRHKDIPNDINEAVSSLIFASARCGDLPELRAIRKLFGERYGQRFAMAAVELFPGNLVNHQIKDKLSAKPVPDDIKQQLLDEIVSAYSIKPEPLAIEFASELQQQEKENSGHQVLVRYIPTNEIEGYQIQDLSSKEIMGIARLADSSSISKKCLSKSCQNSDVTSTSVSSSIVRQSSHDMSESPTYDQGEEVENGGSSLHPSYELTVADRVAKQSQNTDTICTNTSATREERTRAASSSESLYQFPEEKIVYLDDIEEFESSKMKDGTCQDQRLFKFKSSVQPVNLSPENGDNESYIDNNEAWYEKAESRSSRKSTKASGKRLRRRSLSQESRGMDMECFIYYGEPASQKHKTNHYRKHQKKTTHDFQLCECRHNGDTDKCSLEQPCYCCTGDEKDCWEVPITKLKRGITTVVGFGTHSFLQEDLCDNFSHYSSGNGKPEARKLIRTTHKHDATVYDFFTYSDHHKQSKEMKGIAENFDSLNGSSPRETSSWTRKEVVPPYVRAETMPIERPKGGFTGNILRSNSCPYQHPRHVHPKLPDYDDIAAKFMALKKEHQQKQSE